MSQLGGGRARRTRDEERAATAVAVVVGDFVAFFDGATRVVVVLGGVVVVVRDVSGAVLVVVASLRTTPRVVAALHEQFLDVVVVGRGRSSRGGGVVQGRGGEVEGFVDDHTRWSPGVECGGEGLLEVCEVGAQRHGRDFGSGELALLDVEVGVDESGDEGRHVDVPRHAELHEVQKDVAAVDPAARIQQAPLVREAAAAVLLGDEKQPLPVLRRRTRVDLRDVLRAHVPQKSGDVVDALDAGNTHKGHQKRLRPLGVPHPDQQSQQPIEKARVLPLHVAAGHVPTRHGLEARDELRQRKVHRAALRPPRRASSHLRRGLVAVSSSKRSVHDGVEEVGEFGVAGVPLVLAVLFEDDGSPVEVVLEGADAPVAEDVEVYREGDLAVEGDGAQDGAVGVEELGGRGRQAASGVRFEGVEFGEAAGPLEDVVLHGHLGRADDEALLRLARVRVVLVRWRRPQRSGRVRQHPLKLLGWHWVPRRRRLLSRCRCVTYSQRKLMRWSRRRTVLPCRRQRMRRERRRGRSPVEAPPLGRLRPSRRRRRVLGCLVVLSRVSKGVCVVVFAVLVDEGGEEA
mmetsp:Transcript_17950/g.54905  ORF Transcript_17950/g.54905 Transcript_17950/m.54905 type:complete len:572 (+) Transcript_17950:1856-3571(+)